MKLIDKDRVVEEIERIKKEECPTDTYEGRCKMLWFEQFSSFLDTLEVKEVDLENEYTEEVYSHLDSIKDTADRMTSGNFMHNIAAIKFSANTIAEVLELMGLRAQKGE